MSSNPKKPKFLIDENDAVWNICKQISDLSTNPPHGWLINVDLRNLLQWNLTMFGPPGTLYEGGRFEIRLTFTRDFPSEPPVLEFLTPIWHPNVNVVSGLLRMSMLEAQTPDRLGWKDCFIVKDILAGVISLMHNPDVTHAANEEAAHMYTNTVFVQDEILDYVSEEKEEKKEKEEEKKKEKDSNGSPGSKQSCEKEIEKDDSKPSSSSGSKEPSEERQEDDEPEAADADNEYSSDDVDEDGKPKKKLREYEQHVLVFVQRSKQEATRSGKTILKNAEEYARSGNVYLFYSPDTYLFYSPDDQPEPSEKK